MGLIVGATKDFLESLDPFIKDPDDRDYAAQAQSYAAQLQAQQISTSECADLLKDIQLLKQIDDLERETSLYILAVQIGKFIEFLRSQAP